MSPSMSVEAGKHSFGEKYLMTVTVYGVEQCLFFTCDHPKKALHDSIISEVSPDNFLTADHTLSYKLEHWGDPKTQI